MGTNFSVTPQARNLVTTGVYSKIRNPVYVFGGIAVAAFFLYLHRYIWVLAFLPVIVPIQWLRARAEARVLERTAELQKSITELEENQRERERRVQVAVAQSANSFREARLRIAQGR